MKDRTITLPLWVFWLLVTAVMVNAAAWAWVLINA